MAVTWCTPLSSFIFIRVLVLMGIAHDPHGQFILGRGTICAKSPSRVGSYMDVHPFGNTTSFLGLLWPPVVLCHPLNIRNYQKRTTIFGEGRYNKGTTLSRLFTPCPNRWNTLPGRVLEAVLRP